MRSRLLIALLGIFALSPCKTLSHRRPGPSPSSRETGFTIAGVVLQHSSNQPLKRVEVSVISVEHRDQQLSCRSASNGGFEFTGLSAGKYTLVAQLHGFTQAFRGNEDYSTAIVVGPGLDSEHITFLVDAPAVISGTVIDIDDDGEPVRNAQVFLFHRGIFSGRPRIVMQMQENTNSSGAFHFAHLKPGTYFVAVSARPWYAQNVPVQPQSETSSQNASTSNLDVAYPLTYYPDSLDPAAASPITLAEAGVSEIRLALHAVPALRLDVHVSSDQALSFGISAAGPGGVRIPIDATQFTENDRRGILGLAPGHYVLTLQGREQGANGAVATKTVDLTTNSTLDLNDLPKTSISGQVQLEASERPNRLAVWLVNVNNGRATGGPVESNGSFKIGSIRPGRYEFRLANTQELYIKSVAVNGAEQPDRAFDATEGASVQVAIIAAKGLTRLNGIAMKDDKPFPGAMVLLLPRDSNHGGYIPRDQSDSDGTFTLNLVEPGRYTLIAIDDGRDLAYRDPSVIKPYLAQAQIIEVPLPGDRVLKVDAQNRRP